MTEKLTKIKSNFHKYVSKNDAITLNEYKSIILYKKMLIFSIAISVIFWVLITIALATPNYDNAGDSLYINIKIKYHIYVAIFFFLALFLWGINVIIYIYLAICMSKLRCEISKELLWLSIVNIFFSVVIIFSIIALTSINIFLKNNADKLTKL